MEMKRVQQVVAYHDGKWLIFTLADVALPDTPNASVFECVDLKISGEGAIEATYFSDDKTKVVLTLQPGFTAYSAIEYKRGPDIEISVDHCAACGENHVITASPLIKLRKEETMQYSGKCPKTGVTIWVKALQVEPAEEGSHDDGA